MGVLLSVIGYISWSRDLFTVSWSSRPLISSLLRLNSVAYTNTFISVIVVWYSLAFRVLVRAGALCRSTSVSLV